MTTNYDDGLFGDIMTIRAAARAYARPDLKLALFHLAVSLALWGAAVTLGTWAWGQGHWLLVALAVVGVFGGQGRLFGVQHDCGHLSYFASPRANVATGVLLGGLTYNPYFAMRYNHNRHHAFVGNLDRMESHEVLTWTVAQWHEAGPWARLGYRAYRSMPVICLIGPIFVILIRYRYPKNAARTGLWDVLVQNALMAGIWAAVWALGGWTAVQFLLTATVISACVAVFVVYVGHNHEDTYWQREDHVDFEKASLQGASVLCLGPVFDFLSLNFAYHDLHHLNARIPAYRLRQCHRDLAPLLEPRKLGLRDALRCLHWKLWDEEQARMVRFCDVRDPLPAMQRTA
jgi:omega-6 fatty acid desaturase (delta-12 desaturase)